MPHKARHKITICLDQQRPIFF